MPTTITFPAAVEHSTFIVKIQFYDEENTPVIPETFFWTLTRGNGAVINDRENISRVVAATEETLLLSGDDLAIFPGDDYQRILTIHGTYYSTLGEDIFPFADELYFQITNLKNIQMTEE